MRGEFLSIQEFADTFGVHYATAWYWVRDGKVPSVRIGSRARIPRRWVEEQINAAIATTISPNIEEAPEREVGGRLPGLARPLTLVGSSGSA